MLKKSDKLLLAGTIAIGVADLLLANGIYLKKKGIVLKDIALTSIDQKLRGSQSEGTEAKEIPIE